MWKKLLSDFNSRAFKLLRSSLNSLILSQLSLLVLESHIKRAIVERMANSSDHKFRIELTIFGWNFTKLKTFSYFLASRKFYKFALTSRELCE